MLAPGQPINREPIYRQIYRSLEQQIVSGQLTVGTALPAETEIANQFEVHRSSVREALRLLEENGLVNRKQGGKKLFVTPPDKRKISQRLVNSFLMEEITLGELYEAGRMLESQAVSMAATRITPEQLAKLERNLQETETHFDDQQKLESLDSEFHELLAEAAGNRVMVWTRLGVAEFLYPTTHRLFDQLDMVHKTRMLEAHRNIVQGLAEGNADKARTWAEKHFDDFIRACQLAGINLDDAATAVGKR